MDVAIGQPEVNLRRIEEATRDAAAHGASLVVFPECAVTGYCFASLEEARPLAQSTDGEHVRRLAALCAAEHCHVVVGMLEASAAGDLFNACVLVGPEGLVGTYRKIHLPFLGVDRFVTPGDRPPDVWACGAARIGMNICYDVSFPETSRIMALAGADLVVLPTNWPPAAISLSDFVMRTRAMENHVWVIGVNRVGRERGFSFIGRSSICDPSGNVVASAGDEETILYAQIDLLVARNKHLVRKPGEHEIDRFRDRRPELYGAIAECRTVVPDCSERSGQSLQTRPR
jgi:predicted amidohydrolase